MSNLLMNCGFMDGISGWTGSPPALSIRVDEETRGSPGRMALVGQGTATTADQVFSLYSGVAGRAGVAGLSHVEFALGCAVWVAGVPRQPVVRAVFLDAGGAVLLSQDLTPQAPHLDRWGIGQAGVMATYWTVWARLERPANAVQALISVEVKSTGAGQAMEVALIKPGCGPVRADGRVGLWSPGRHTGPDLDRPAWPDSLRLVDVSQGAEAKPARLEFEAGSGRPSSRRIAHDPARKLSGRVRCDQVQRAVLEQFAARTDQFWFVEPDSERLCVASWAADGAPRLAEVKGALHLMEVSMWLETA